MLPSAKNAGWHDLSIINAGIPTEYANKAWEVWIVSWEVNSPLSNKILIKSSEKLKKAIAVGIEKKSPIFRDIIKLFEKFFLSFFAFSFDKEVNRTEPNAMPMMPKGNCAILSAK